ncbi:ATP-binding protein DrrA1-3 family domain-containing protein, partial [Planomicrobium okeanokoites]
GTKDELKSILSSEETVWIELDRPYPAFFKELQSIESIKQAIETEKGIKLILPKGSRVLGKVFQASERHHVQIINVNVQTPSLEDVFLHLTGRKLRD